MPSHKAAQSTLPTDKQQLLNYVMSFMLPTCIIYLYYGNHFVSLGYLLILIGYKTYHQLAKIFSFHMVNNLLFKTQEGIIY